jgi:hypothetical protein
MPELAKAAKGEHVTKAPFFHKAAIESVGGQQFTSFAKASQFGKGKSFYRLNHAGKKRFCFQRSVRWLGDAGAASKFDGGIVAEWSGSSATLVQHELQVRIFQQLIKVKICACLIYNFYLLENKHWNFWRASMLIRAWEYWFSVKGPDRIFMECTVDEIHETLVRRNEPNFVAVFLSESSTFWV